jgi:hypothetical protein
MGILLMTEKNVKQKSALGVPKNGVTPQKKSKKNDSENAGKRRKMRAKKTPFFDHPCKNIADPRGFVVKRKRKMHAYARLR